MTGMGSTDLKRHLAGIGLTAMQAIRAKCADCTGNYADGRVSCELPECLLFPFHPYNASRRISRRAKWSEPLRVDNELNNGNSWRESHEKDQTALRPRI
jgi:hypothetical protein